MGSPPMKKKATALLLASGVMTVSAGAALIYPPAGLVCLGVLLILAGLFAVEVGE